MKERKTLGLLINDIDGSYQTFLWLMIKKACEKLDCNLFVYEGRSLKSDIYADEQHHIIYNFIDIERIDGLIITSGTLSNYITKEEFVQFCKKYSKIPAISLGVEIPGFTSLLFDNKEGMKNLIRHLTNEHNYNKIVFVTGPQTNQDSNERFEAYREVLEESNIKFDESLVFHGDFVSDTGYMIMEQIILSDMEYDAVVFANDDMALGAIKCTKDYKNSKQSDFQKKCIICGFDDSLNSSRVKPSLTTVRQPLREMCYEAVETLLRKLDGEDIEDVIVFPSVMVQRESCGCSHSCDNDEDDKSNGFSRLLSGFRIHENIQTYQIEELFEKLASSLKKCYVKSCFISKYIDGTVLYKESMVLDDTFSVPNRSELIFAYYNERRKAIDDSIKNIRTTHIVPECFIPKDRRFIYLVNPLFFQNEHFGFVCFEVANDDVVNFEPVRGQISNTLKGAIMLLEREKMEESLRESERLASLGQLIGGISHNLMTPIMSIAGVSTGLEDLINEYRDSIADSSVTKEDHEEISREMMQWVDKLRDYNAYMSKVISTVKTQAVQLNSDAINEFTIEELINRIKFLKGSDITIKKSNFSLSVDVNNNVSVNGDISNMIQILDNLIKNAIQSYEGKELRDCKVDLHIGKEGNMIKITVKDYGEGLRDDTKDKIFRHMVTTKGKNGTGLSLLLSYSTIKGKFGGDIWFESRKGEGTEFNVVVPIR